MTAARFVLYGAGLLFALLMAGRLFAGRSRPSMLFGAAMSVWALNCVILLALLVSYIVTGNLDPPWGSALLTLNAFLLAVAPAALYLFFEGGRNANP